MVREEGEGKRERGRAFQDQKIAYLPPSLSSSRSLYHCYARAAARTGILKVCMLTHTHACTQERARARWGRWKGNREVCVCVCALWYACFRANLPIESNNWSVWISEICEIPVLSTQTAPLRTAWIAFNWSLRKKYADLVKILNIDGMNIASRQFPFWSFTRDLSWIYKIIEKNVKWKDFSTCFAESLLYP